MLPYQLLVQQKVNPSQSRQASPAQSYPYNSQPAQIAYPTNLLVPSQSQALEANPYVQRPPSRFSNMRGRSVSAHSRRRPAQAESTAYYTHMKSQPWLQPPAGRVALRPSVQQPTVAPHPTAQHPYQDAANISSREVLLKHANSV